MATRVAEMVAELEARAKELRPLAAELVEVEAALAALKSVTVDKDATAADSSPAREASPASTRQRRARTGADGGSRTRRRASRKSSDDGAATSASRSRPKQ